MPKAIPTGGGTSFRLSDAEFQEHQRRKNQRRTIDKLLKDAEAQSKTLKEQQELLATQQHTIARMESQLNLALTRVAVLENKQRRLR